MNSLPLSWTTHNPTEFTQTIKTKNICWISHASLHKDQDFFKTIETFYNESNDDIIIRGCNSTIKNYLVTKGFKSIKAGSEAVLDTSKNCFKKKSLKELVRRGLKKGTIDKLYYSDENKKKLEEFVKLSTHYSEPQLHYLFITEFKPNNILYILHKDEIWIGAILISENSEKKIHTELILRKKDSPVGTLEAIIHQIYQDAKIRNFNYVSLGEVPFVNPVHLSKDEFYSTLTTLIGRIFGFAYNYRGLRNFKDKFNPDWEPVFICVSHRIAFKHIFFMFIKTNFYHLILYKMLYTIKNLMILNTSKLFTKR